MRIAILLLIWTLAVSPTLAQTSKEVNFLSGLPKDLKVDNSSPRTYQMVTDYYSFDIKGEFLGKMRVKGFITYGLERGSVRWSDVNISQSKSLENEFPEAVSKQFMQNFTYIPSDYILTSEFFENNIPEADPSIMNLIWDALCFDEIAYSCWDSLSLNEEFQAKSMNSELEIANVGTFENKDIKITWIGITEKNDEVCAILKYSVMNNPLKMEMGDVSMTGRSHYWGEIYVSLEDKQIEYATLTEDVLTNTIIRKSSGDILGYTIRTIDFSKVK